VTTTRCWTAGTLISIRYSSSWKLDFQILVGGAEKLLKLESQEPCSEDSGGQ